MLDTTILLQRGHWGRRGIQNCRSCEFYGCNGGEDRNTRRELNGAFVEFNVVPLVTGEMGLNKAYQ